MEVLVLSCGTGGGHNTAALAVADEMKRRGHNVRFEDVYGLVGKNASRRVNNAYIKMAQRTPKLFGCVYAAGEAYRRLPINSPVYWANGKFSGHLGEHLKTHSYDTVVTSHMFAAHMLKYLKANGENIPKSVLVATDYTCAPFTEESDCDLYVVPHEDLVEEFVSKGIDKSKIKPFGIPVRREFTRRESRETLRRRLALDDSGIYFLVSGGSIGAGCIPKAIETLNGLLQKDERFNIIAICGNNDKLYRELFMKYRSNRRIRILKQTAYMADYMKACDVFLTKAGGLSSTEAAVAGVPLVHLAPIPGCESLNTEYFAKRNISVYANDSETGLLKAIHRLKDPDFAHVMSRSQAENINRNATADLCDYIEREL